MTQDPVLPHSIGKRGFSKPKRIVLADMQVFLEQNQPATASAALNVLQRTFPKVPLDDRVQACEIFADLHFGENYLGSWHAARPAS